jgi:hypothetical protein
MPPMDKSMHMQMTVRKPTGHGGHQ